MAYVLVAFYATASAARIAGLQPRILIQGLLPPALASATMTAALYPLEHLAIHADQRGTAVGLSLLVTEVILGAAIYLAVVYLLDPALVMGFLHNIKGAWKGRASAEVGAKASPLPPTSE